MSFRCQICGEAQPAGVRPVLLVTKMRKREYFHNGSVSLGCEIDTQVRACPDCAQEVKEPEMVNFSMGSEPMRHTMSTRLPTAKELAETNIMSKPAPKQFKIKEQWDG